MLKSSRPFSRSLVLSAALAVGMPSVLGCQDPNDPATYVKQLEDPGRRTAAVDRLVTFFDDAYSKDRSADDTAEQGATAIGPNVKLVLDKIITPLTELCIKGELDEKSHAKVVKFAAATRDPRADACILATLKNYKLGSTEANVKEAVRSVAATGSKEAAPAVFEVFQKMRASNEKVKETFVKVDLYRALRKLKDPAWEGELLKIIAKEANLTSLPKEKSQLADLVDQAFWQATALVLLGDIKSAKAVQPILKVVLTPSKGPLELDALNALIKIGKPASEAALALLKGENKELVEFAKDAFLKSKEKPTDADKKAADQHPVNYAANVLATIGRSDSVASFVEVMGKADEVPRALIATRLVQLPKSPEALKAWSEAYEKTGLTTTLPDANRTNAKVALLGVAPRFYDRSLMEGIIKAAKEAKGEEDDVSFLKEQTFIAVLKMAQPADLAMVDEFAATKVKGADGTYVAEYKNASGKAVKEEFEATDDDDAKQKVMKKLDAATFDKWQAASKDAKKTEEAKKLRGELEDKVNKAELKLEPKITTTTLGKSMQNELKAVKELLTECGDKPDCYLAKLSTPKAKERDGLIGIKSILMIGAIAKEDFKPKILEALPKITDFKGMTAALLDTLSPKGDKATSDALQKMIDAADESKDDTKKALVSPFKQIVYRLNARLE